MLSTRGGSCCASPAAAAAAACSPPLAAMAAAAAAVGRAATGRSAWRCRLCCLEAKEWAGGVRRLRAICKPDLQPRGWPRQHSDDVRIDHRHHDQHRRADGVTDGMRAAAAHRYRQRSAGSLPCCVPGSATFPDVRVLMRASGCQASTIRFASMHCRLPHVPAAAPLHGLLP